MNSLIEKVLRDQFGHWGLIEPAFGTSNLARLICEIRSRPGVKIERIDLKIANTSNCGIEIEPTDPVDVCCREFERYFIEARADGVRCFCCIIEGFETLDVDSQCRLLGFTRKIREQSNELQVQTIVQGSWNRYSLLAQWQANQNISPVLDQRNVHCSDGTNFENLAMLLEQEGLVSGMPNELERLAIEAMLEFTGGDLLLIEEVVEILKAHKTPLHTFQETSKDVISSGKIFDNFVFRLALLSFGGDEILSRVLTSLALVVDQRSPLVEELRLLGFIRLTKRGDKTIASIPSPLMQWVLRFNWKRLKPGLGNVCASPDLNWPLRAINGHAYRLVMDIEVLLRNWLVSGLSRNPEEDWRDSIRDVKTPGSSAGQVTEDILALGNQLIGVLYPDLKLSPSVEDVENPEESMMLLSGQSTKPKSGRDKDMVGVIDSAEEWRKRVGSNVFVRLSETGLPCFFTPGALVGSLMYSKGKVCEAVKSVFDQREELKRFCTKFSTIRSAVAHNQVLAFSALEDLESLLRELEVRFGTQVSR